MKVAVERDEFGARILRIGPVRFGLSWLAVAILLMAVVLTSRSYYERDDRANISSATPTTSPRTIVSGEARACVLYRSRSGEAVAGTMSQARVTRWARNIKEDADLGIYHPLQLAANALYADVKSSSNVEIDRRLVADQQAVLKACASLDL
jgi:hypothetical protein